jgi:hypothetical protein
LGRGPRSDSGNRRSSPPGRRGPPRRRADQVEDVAAVAVYAAHRVDEVGALEACHVHWLSISWLTERERVGLGVSLEERDLEHPLPNSVVLADELVQAAVAKDAVAVLVDVDAV